MKSLAGKFIVLEGPDGGGKSTQAALLRDAIAAQGVPAMVTREPGGTAIGERVREVLLDNDLAEMTVETELFLYMAARAQFIAEVVKPKLDEGYCVISERFLLSTLVYQGEAGGIDPTSIQKMALVAVQGISPAATILLDVPAETGLKRASDNPDRMEAKGLAFHQKVRDGYLKYANEMLHSIVISSEQSIDAVHKHILAFVKTIAK